MGNFFDRSSNVRSEKSKSKIKKRKRKQVEQMDASFDDEKYINQKDDDLKNLPENSYNQQDEWIQRMKQHQLSNINTDPPGAPRTYSMNYPVVQMDSMSKSWSPALDVNNGFFPNTSLPMTTTVLPTSSTMSHVQSQYNHDYMFLNQPTSMTVEERPSKKVQFARPIEQKISSNIPLTATHSWHEPSLTNSNEMLHNSLKQESSVIKTSLHQSTHPTKTNISLSSATLVQKPIYISIDHRATLAERGQTKADKHHHKNTDKTTSNTSTHHRSRGHTQMQTKHQESIDSSLSKQSTSSNKTSESIPHRTLTTISTPMMTSNRQMQLMEQIPNHENQSKRTRHNHQSQNQHIEQQSFTEIDIKSIGTRNNVSQSKQHSRSNTNRNTSPVHNETIRRVEIKQPTTSITNIPLSQTQSRSKSFQQINVSNNITRTRI